MKRGTTYRLRGRLDSHDESGQRTSLRFQERTSDNLTWATLSWRTSLETGSNRRFYIVGDAPWWTETRFALELLQEASAAGWLVDAYLDRRRRPSTLVLDSRLLTADVADEFWRELLLPGEYMPNARFTVCEDPNTEWRKVMLVDGDRITFRSMTTSTTYRPLKHLDNESPWNLDNSMMDFNVQQARAFLIALPSQGF